MSTSLVTGNKTATKAARGDDLYASPYAALPPLLVAEAGKLPRTIWEPAAGNGALVLPLRNRGFIVHASDLRDWGCPECEPEVDFTGQIAVDFRARIGDVPEGRLGIVTNPPFNQLEDFVDRAVSMAPYVAMLCRLAFLESEGRMLWWRRVGLKRVLVIAERLPMMHRHGWDGPKLTTGAMCFAWFIFEPGGRPANSVTLRWVSWKAAARRWPQFDNDDPPAPCQQLGLFQSIAGMQA